MQHDEAVPDGLPPPAPDNTSSPLGTGGPPASEQGVPRTEAAAAAAAASLPPAPDPDALSLLGATGRVVRFTPGGVIDPAKSVASTPGQEEPPAPQRARRWGAGGAPAPDPAQQQAQQVLQWQALQLLHGIVIPGSVPGGLPLPPPPAVDPAAAASASSGKYASLSSDNIGHRLLLKSGWKEGSGLGAQGKGITVPVR